MWGVPAFVSRAFRHNSIYVRRDRVKAPADLKGRRVGLPEYQLTACVWARIILEDDHRGETVRHRLGARQASSIPAGRRKSPSPFPPTCAWKMRRRSRYHLPNYWNAARSDALYRAACAKPRRGRRIPISAGCFPIRFAAGRDYFKTHRHLPDHAHHWHPARVGRGTSMAAGGRVQSIPTSEGEVPRRSRRHRREQGQRCRSSRKSCARRVNSWATTFGPTDFPSIARCSRSSCAITMRRGFRRDWCRRRSCSNPSTQRELRI